MKLYQGFRGIVAEICSKVMTFRGITSAFYSPSEPQNRKPTPFLGFPVPFSVFPSPFLEKGAPFLDFPSPFLGFPSPFSRFPSPFLEKGASFSDFPSPFHEKGAGFGSGAISCCISAYFYLNTIAF